MKLGELLKDAVSAKARRWIYLLLALASLGLAAWQAANGDWFIFVGLVVSGLVNALAASNIQESSGRHEEEATDGMG